MAARDIVVGHPIDVPSIERRDLRYRENKAPGVAEYIAVEPDEPMRMAKGDLGERVFGVTPPRALTKGGPWKGLRPAVSPERASGRGPWKRG